MKRASSKIVFCVLAGAVTVVISCRGSTEVERLPEQQLSPAIAFPDSITKSAGIPPRYVNDSTTVLFGDTLAIAQVATSAFSSRMQLTARFLVADTSNSRLQPPIIPLASCPFLVTLSRAGQSAAVWRSDKAAALLQCPVLQQSTSSTDATATWDVRAILGDSLVSGRYDATFDVRTASGRVFRYTRSGLYFDKDTQSLTSDYGVLQMRATSGLTGEAPRDLTVRAVVQNPTAKTLELYYGACLEHVRLFRSADRKGTPVWKSEFRKRPGSSGVYGCPDVLHVSTLFPGDSLVFPMSVPMYEVIGDSLPSAHYFVSVELQFQGRRLSDGTTQPNVKTTFPAGEVDIVREKVRLPSSRVIDGLSATATTRVVAGKEDDTLRTLVLVTNTTDHRIATTIASGCPVIVYAYRSAALRDSVPIPQPAASPTPGCRIDNYQIALNPGQSWVFGTDTPMSAIRRTPGAGHYWFTAWLTTSTQYLLAAGEADVK